MSITECIIATIAFAIVGFCWYRNSKHKKFSSQGIKGPAPNILFGNLIALRSKKFFEIIKDWQNEFGKLYVYWEGGNPNLVIGDVDLLLDVMVKQFSNFHGRKLFAMQKNPDTDERVSMFTARGKRWKRIRTTINPAFSDKKMRDMYPLIGSCSEDFMTSVKEHVEKDPSSVVIQDLLQRLTLDIISKCAFGVETNSQRGNLKHPLIVALKSFLGGQNFSTWKAALIMTLSELRIPLIYLFSALNLRPANNEHLKTIRKIMIEVIEIRKNNPGDGKRQDLLQLMLNAEVNDKKILDEEIVCPMNFQDSEEPQPADNSAKSKRGKPLTTEEIIQQANLFLFAGYDTSSMAMSYTMYFMAEHPFIQRELHEEIDKAFESVTNLNYDSLELYDALAKLPFLNAVFYEVLRMRPFANTVVNRTCLNKNGTYLSNGVFIPNGTGIIPNAFSIHFDPSVWTGIDPNKFAPERFLEVSETGEREFKGPPHPMAWIPFGAGPRNCVGQRFAIMVIKTNLGRFFRDYSVEFSKDTQRPLDLRVAATIMPTKPVTLAVFKRNH